jgi:hypothetical protein
MTDTFRACGSIHSPPASSVGIIRTSDIYMIEHVWGWISQNVIDIRLSAVTSFHLMPVSSALGPLNLELRRAFPSPFTLSLAYSSISLRSRFLRILSSPFNPRSIATVSFIPDSLTIEEVLCYPNTIHAKWQLRVAPEVAEETTSVTREGSGASRSAKGTAMSAWKKWKFTMAGRGDPVIGE